MNFQTVWAELLSGYAPAEALSNSPGVIQDGFQWSRDHPGRFSDPRFGLSGDLLISSSANP